MICDDCGQSFKERQTMNVKQRCIPCIIKIIEEYNNDL